MKSVRAADRDLADRLAVGVVDVAALVVDQPQVDPGSGRPT